MVPRVGVQHIQVGRARTRSTRCSATSSGSPTAAPALRFVIGEYGSGKTFFLHLVRSIALEKRLVTAHADLTPDRRLHATGGQARSLYAELMRNIATRAQARTAGRWPSVVERFVTTALDRGPKSGRREPGDA